MWVDPKLVRLSLIPGTVEPGGEWANAGQVPPAELPNLIGAFNGGWKWDALLH